MIKIENLEVIGWKHVIRGIRNQTSSLDKSDSGICKGGDNGIGCTNCVDCGCDHSYDYSWKLGKKDRELMIKLIKDESIYRKFRQMITVYMDIIAPLYWWEEFDIYKLRPAINSCNMMEEKICSKKFTIDDFSHEHLFDGVADGIVVKDPIHENENAMVNPKYCLYLNGLKAVINLLNDARDLYLLTKDKTYWWQMIQLLPSSYNQKRTVMLNYEVLSNIYEYRREHKLDEWREFCQWIKKLPYNEIITCSVKGEKDGQ